MAEDWIIEAKRRVLEFFDTATPEEIRKIGDECGYEVYSQNPSQAILDFDAPDLTPPPSTEVYLIVGTMYPAYTPSISGAPDNYTDLSIPLPNGK